MEDSQREPLWGDPDSIFPVDLSEWDEFVDAREEYERVLQRLVNLGVWSTEYMSLCFKEEDDYYERREAFEARNNNSATDNDIFLDVIDTCVGTESMRTLIEMLWDDWMMFYTEYIAKSKEVQVLSFDPSAFGYTESGKRYRVKLTLESHLFVEIVKLKYFLLRPDILDDADRCLDLTLEEHKDPELLQTTLVFYSLQLTKGDAWVKISESFTVEYDEELGPDEEDIAKQRQLQEMTPKPILEYKQSEIVALVLFLSQLVHELNEYDSDNLYEYYGVLNLVLYRCNMLLSDSHQNTVMDMPHFCTKVWVPRTDFEPNDPYARKYEKNGMVSMYSFNRKFVTFLSCYLMELCRRRYHAHVLHKNHLFDSEELLSRRRIDEMAANTRQWFAIEFKRVPTESIRDLKRKAANAAFDFPADRAYFEYAFAQKTYSINACMQEIRPHLRDAYVGKSLLTADLIVKKADSDYLSKRFILLVVNEILKSKFGTKWLDLAIIESNAIEAMCRPLHANEAPYLIQIVSSFVAYDQGCIHQTDDIYESLAIWFYLLATRYNQTLFGYDLSDVCRTILKQRADSSENANSQQHQPFITADSLFI